MSATGKLSTPGRRAPGARTDGSSSRTRLLLLWHVVRIWYSAHGTLLVACTAAIGATDEAWRSAEGADAHHALDVPAYILCGLSWLGCAAACTPANRGRWLAALRRIASHGQGEEAAVVASLVSKAGSPQQALALARETFRGLPVEAITFEHLSSSGDTGLHAATHSCKCDGVDAFLSHSWHDPAAPKMAGITHWREDFEAAHGRSPVVWLEYAAAT